MDGVAADRAVRGNAGMALLPGLLMTLYGWYTSFLLAGDGSIHDVTMSVVQIVLRYGGPLFLIAAGLCVVGRREGLWVDFGASALCGGLLLLIGVFWIIVDRDLNDFLYTIFGAVMLGSVRHTWRLLGETGGMGHAPAEARAVEKAAPVVERELPTVPDGPPPADGYLAALGRAAKDRREGRKGGDGGS